MICRWEHRPFKPEVADRLARGLKVHPVTATVLASRGFTDVAAAEAFLNPRMQDVHNPFLMRGMRRAVDRLQQAIEQQQKVLIYGDYDVDGITSTVVLRRALEMSGASCGYYIPKRLVEGYGLKEEVIEKAALQGYQVIISVDCGIRAMAPSARARELGIDLIITDHHLPGKDLPEAFAILNPRQDGCPYPDKDLAGVGIVFKLVHALFQESERLDLLPHFLKLVAIGTVADMAPLRGENRILVRFGLEGLTAPYNLGLQALLQGSGVGKKVTHSDIGFRVAPRINAFTRMGGGGEIVELFWARDPGRAFSFVEEMNRRNIARREEEDRILSQAMQQLEEQGDIEDRHFLVAAGEGWHRGVLGNVAARLVEKFHRPSLVFSIQSDRCQGSGRSIEGFHLLSALDQCASVFSSYGGHAQAAGCTLDGAADNDVLGSLTRQLEKYARQTLAPEDLYRRVRVDSQVKISDLTFNLCDELERLGPFGIGNPIPVLASHNVPIAGGPWILKDRHLKMQVQSGFTRLDVLWWKQAERFKEITRGAAANLAYTLRINEFRGQKSLQLTLRDLKMPKSTEERLLTGTG